MRPFTPVIPALAFLLPLVTGCTGPKDTDEHDSPPPISTGDSVDCDANAPVVTSVTISNGGIQSFDNGDYTTVAVNMEVSDDDGDLDVIGMYIWFDNLVDGAVDRTGEASFSSDAYLFANAVPCGKFTASFSLKPAVTGTTLDWNTVYEFAVEAEDHHGVMSAPFVASGVTPNSDGTDGTAG